MKAFKRWILLFDSLKALEKNVRRNRFYPFQEVCCAQENDRIETSDHVFVYSKRYRRFYFFIVLAVLSALCIIIWLFIGEEREYMVFTGGTLLASVYLSVEYYYVNTVVLDPATNQYSVYRGETLVDTQHCHNIFIRLINKKAGTTKQPQYLLILNGWGMAANVELCRDTTNRRRLRQLGQELARNLKINYFDLHDSSKHHIVRHRPPQSMKNKPQL